MRANKPARNLRRGDVAYLDSSGYCGVSRAFTDGSRVRVMACRIGNGQRVNVLMHRETMVPVDIRD